MTKDKVITKFCKCGQKAILRWRGNDVCEDCLFPDNKECQYEPQLMSCHFGHVEGEMPESVGSINQEHFNKRCSQYLDAKEEGKVFEIKEITVRRHKTKVARRIRVKRGLPINLKENK